MGDALLATTSVSPVVDEVIPPQSILDVIREWNQSWFWKKLNIVGDVDWVIEAIARCLLLILADGSFIRELFPDANSCAFVVECQEGRGRILGKVLECSNDACAYRGDRLVCWPFTLFCCQ